MNRRTFTASLAGAGAALAQSDAPHTRFYLLETFLLKQGSQLPRIHEHVSRNVLPALAKVHSGAKIVLESLVAPHMPQVALVTGFSSWEEIWNVHAKAGADPELGKAHAQLDAGAEPPFESQTNTLLQAASYSPEIKPEPRKTPRVFELRVYHSPTWTQLQALHERFAGPEVKIFHRVGIHPVLYATTILGANMPNLTYLIPFENLAAREKAWEAFGADPEWQKVRKESVDKHGQIASVIQIALYRAAPYSPVK